MESIQTFETAVDIYQATRRHTEKRLGLQHSGCANLKPRKYFSGCASSLIGRSIHKILDFAS
jgi:hypothetical protein